MLSIFGRSTRMCDRIPRRALLRAGSLAAIGRPISVVSANDSSDVRTSTAGASTAGASTAGASTAGTAAAESAATPCRTGSAKRCIVLFLLGGPAQHSTWDPKPDAPAEVRGDFSAISTRVPGVRIGELMPQSATMLDEIAILRAVVTGDNAHSSSGYFMMTGVPHAPMNRENANPGAPNDWPTMAAVAQQLATGARLLPPAVRLPHHIFNTDGSVWPGQDSGWLGHAADPWLLNCQPASSDFAIPQFQLAADVTLDRLARRRSLLDQMETQLRTHEATALPYADQQRQAFDLLGSSRSRASCDLTREDDTTRDRYGRGQFGQSVLLGRRLLEAGVEFVQVNWFRGADEPSDAPCWDSHSNESKRLKDVLVPPFDQALTALISDLKQRGMLDDTLIVSMAEFGRTPRFNARAGRDHWGHVFSIALAGGGIRGGVVHGQSDKQAAWPDEGIVHPQDITATMFHCLGYSPETLLYDTVGRPVPISRGHVIHPILS